MTKAEGFYTAYFTGAEGNSVAVFLFTDGSVVGADIAGTSFDGDYLFDPATQTINFSVKVTLPKNVELIQGGATGSSGMSYVVHANINIDPSDSSFHRIDTPVGPVNMRLVRIRGISRSEE